MLRVLIVDDYADALEAWKLFLELHQFQVVTAADGVQAVEQALKERPDIVMLDLDLPGRSGAEVAQLLRANPATQHIPLVAMTGQSHRSALDRARASGFQMIFVKPFDPEAVVRDLVRLCAPSPGT